MKYFLGILIAALVIIKAFEVAPLTQAPLQVIEKLPIQATVTKEIPKKEAMEADTKTLLNLLEIAIDQEHDFSKGLTYIRQAPLNEDSQKLIKLYEAKILARTLDFEKATQLLQTINDEEIIIIKAAVLIASSDRDRAGAYLHDLADQHPNPEVRLTAISLLNIYRNFDTFRDADESYLWTLFAKKLGELGELEISLYLAEKAADKNPEYRDAWIIKGYDELTLKKTDLAEISLLTAYKLDPGNPHVQYLLGLTYFELNKPDLSTQYLLYARQEEKEYERIILEKLAENAVKTEDFALATHYFEELLKIDPTNERAITKLLWIRSTNN